MAIKQAPPVELPEKYQEKINEVTRRIVETAQPKRILLFGSLVRGNFHQESDMDVLVIMAEAVHRRKLAQKIYRHLQGVGVAVDVVVVTEEDVRKYHAKPGVIITPAIAEGIVIYESA